MSKELNYIKRKTRQLTPSERFLWVEKNIFTPLRLESIRYVNGEPIPIPDEIDIVGEALLDKSIVNAD